MSNLKQSKVNHLPENYEKLEAIARSRNLTVAQLTREILADYLGDESLAKIGEVPRKRLDPKPEKVEFIFDKKWMKQYVGIARNINQMTEFMHRKKSLISLKALKQFEDAVNRLNDTIQEYMKSQK